MYWCVTVGQLGHPPVDFLNVALALEKRRDGNEDEIPKEIEYPTKIWKIEVQTTRTDIQS